MAKENYPITVIQRFLHIADQFPERSALRFVSNGEWQTITYAELFEEARRLASHLIHSSFQKGDAVIVPSLRNGTLCGSLLGILWAGGHYVFIDPNYPLERQKFICEDAGATFGIYEGEKPPLDLNLNWQKLPLSDNTYSMPDTIEDAELPAYIMYTSGSTGKPKGVVVPHRGITRLVVDTDYITFNEAQIFLQLSALSFDASTLEIWGALLNGGTCVLHPENELISPAVIQDTIISQGITTLWLTSSLYNTIISENPDTLKSVKQLLTGGEVLSVSHIRMGLERLPETRLFNGYGPTENTTFTTIYPIPKDLPEDTKRIPIGYPIHGTHCELFDDELRPIPENSEEGELIVFGEGVALGYLNREDLTAERFIDIKCGDGEKRRGYRTGDIVVRNDNGSYDFLQRKDKQVKIDGHRIEPGEIELCLNQLEQIVEARVVVKTGAKGQKRLAAYYVSKGKADTGMLRSAIAETMPLFMVPHFFIALPELPKNQNGKLDESKLPDPFASRPESRDSDNVVAECWFEILGRKVSVNDNFLDAGGTSLEALQLTQLLEKRFKQELSATFVFEYTTINSQSLFFRQEQSTSVAQTPYVTHFRDQDKPQIAVVGMVCRLPGANNVDEYWNNLLTAKESISFFNNEELDSEIDPAESTHRDYVRAKGIIENFDHFDAAFFGISPLEAKIMDPQQRIMLELAWHALEDAGLAGDEQAMRIGVFAGMNWARYFQQYVLTSAEIKDSYGLFNASLANESDFLCSRISHKLNLKGPSINIFTACSTGLVAIAQACANIESGDCEAALAGGVSIATPVKSGYIYQEGSMLSKDGHCRPFDSNASGTTFNDGAGFVVLKRLDLAQRDGDIIHAVIKGYAVNNDGKNKASFTAPSVKGQVQVYDAVLAKAGISADSIGFIETHGTATPLGDPIEVKALAESYALSSPENAGSCAIGSVKSNIGHTIHAAGIASFIKTVKAVESGKIPPTLHFSTPNPKLELEKTPFFVNNEVISWRKEVPRRAAVSSLGVGGTNAHVIIEQYTDKKIVNKPAEELNPPHPGFPVFLSAKDKESLSLLIKDYRKFFASQPDDAPVIDISYTTLHHRQHFQYRAAFSCTNAADAARQLENEKMLEFGKAPENSESKTGFMFSGQGSQRKFMGQWLYRHNEPFQRLFDEGCEIIRSEQGFDLKEILFGTSDQEDPEVDINQTQLAQPALFLIEYGLAKYLQSCGCTPDFLLGHSIGEFAAAALAGIMSFEQAVRIVCKRGTLMQSCKPGKMLAVMATADAIEGRVDSGLSLAVVNAPDRLVFSGPEENVQKAAAGLEKQDISCSILYTSHAFHSAMMEPIVDEFRSFIATMDLAPPEIPLFSTATGKLLTAEQATDPSYWAMQIRHAVRFADAVSSVRTHFEGDNIAFLEVGPGTVLSTLVKCQNGEARNHILATAPSSAIDDSFISEFSGSLNSLWTAGFKVNWSKFFEGMTPKRAKLPGYAFLPVRHWLEKPNTSIASQIEQPKAIKTQPEIQTISMSAEEHLQSIEKKIRDLLEEVSGFDLADVDADDHFSEIGLDSLLLTQAATMIDRQFSVGTTFRHLVEEYTSIGLLRDFIAEQVPPETKEVVVESPTPAINSHLDEVAMPISNNSNIPPGSVEQLIAQQLQIMQLQLKAIQGGSIGSPLPQTTAIANASTTTEPPKETAPAASPEKATESPKVRHTPGTRIIREKIGVKLTKAQENWINDKLTAYQKKFASSKQSTQENRKYLADPRTVSGFNPEWKDIIFPIVTNRSKGSKIWDIDGNELIDTSNGFGPIFFGHSPDFVTEAVKKLIEEGIETGPQSPLAGEVAKLFCELTGNERCSFASTGSEAVIGAIRLARTVTGRDKVVMFEGSYHGIFDEVINRPGKNFQALPAAPGILREMTNNMLVIPWGDPESLEFIKEKGSELAAVLVEPVQSRHPDFHDQEYLKKIREVTLECGTAMILDEVVTGFRTHPGGIRKLFDIDADLGTYGKVVGGGYPIGIIGGKAKFMDALDGGYWEYGNDSIPECGVTFFAGTFVRHPVALAAAKAVLEKIKEDGGKLYKQLEKNTSKMAEEAIAFTKQLNCDVKFEHFASIFYFAVPGNAHWGHLLFTLMTLQGIHTQQFRPNFLTTEHSDADISAILNAFKNSLAELVAHGLIDGDMVAAKKFLNTKSEIPAGARLGKNSRGEPAYFIEDPNQQGNYIEVGKP